MTFTAYLALGSTDAAGAFTEVDDASYGRQAVEVDARDANGRPVFGGQLPATTKIHAQHVTGRSAVIFAGSFEAEAQALYAWQTGGTPFAWWPAQADASRPYTREGGEIGEAPSGGPFELVLDRTSGGPVPRSAQA